MKNTARDIPLDLSKAHDARSFTDREDRSSDETIVVLLGMIGQCNLEDANGLREIIVGDLDELDPEILTAPNQVRSVAGLGHVDTTAFFLGEKHHFNFDGRGH
jgi:hypothetical protein